MPPLSLHPLRRWLMFSCVVCGFTACGGGSIDGAPGSAATAGPQVKTTGGPLPDAQPIAAGNALRGTVLSTSSTEILTKKVIDNAVTAAARSAGFEVRGAL